jgi:hypothetical protein
MVAFFASPETVWVKNIPAENVREIKVTVIQIFTRIVIANKRVLPVNIKK